MITAIVCRRCTVAAEIHEIGLGGTAHVESEVVAVPGLAYWCVAHGPDRIQLHLQRTLTGLCYTRTSV